MCYPMTGVGFIARVLCITYDYGFDILRENNCDFSKETQNKNLNTCNVDLN